MPACVASETQTGGRGACVKRACWVHCMLHIGQPRLTPLELQVARGANSEQGECWRTGFPPPRGIPARVPWCALYPPQYPRV